MRDEGMSPEEALIAEMDARLVRALEDRPAASVPADFAARVARQVPARREVSLTPRHYGRNAMLICMVVLAVALSTLAMQGAGNSSLGVVWEWIGCAQLVSLAVWLGMWQRSLR
jgi:hypothetical protein